MGYIYPTNTTRVSDDFAAHVARGSVNPGTDYVCWRVDVLSVASGVVTNTDGNPSGSGGRMIHIDHDDGTGADYLHLDALSVSRGDRVAQGQKIAVSGNSGDPVGGGVYGYHLHISFRRRHGAAYTNAGNIDFDALMHAQTGAAGTGAQPLTPTTHTVQEDDMRTIKRQKSGVFYTIGQQYIKRSYDTNTSTISSYLYGDVRELNEPDFYRALSNAGIPFSEFAKADRDPKGGWSASRGVFSEEPFPAVS